MALDEDQRALVSFHPGVDWCTTHGTRDAGLAAAKTNNTLGVAGICGNCKVLEINISDAYCNCAGHDEVGCGVPDAGYSVKIENAGRGTGESSLTGRSPVASRHRVPWAQLLRRVLHLDALACPRCTTAARRVPMVVLAFLTDPDVVGRILRHLGLPACAPVLAPARSAGIMFDCASAECERSSGEGDGDGWTDDVTVDPRIRPPP